MSGRVGQRRTTMDKYLPIHGHVIENWPDKRDRHKKADKIEDVQNGRSNGQTLEDRQTHRESKLELILNFKIR